jgi:hypothetical protein
MLPRYVAIRIERLWINSSLFRCVFQGCSYMYHQSWGKYRTVAIAAEFFPKSMSQLT